jgi:phage nucleotide-binding protein
MEIKVEVKFESVPVKINRGISFIIYADPGVGKTTLAATLPEEETLIITCEAGLGPLLGTKHIVFNVLQTIKNNNIEKVMEALYKTLRTTDHPFKNVVLDNLSEMEQQLILNLTNLRGKQTPEIREYGDASYKMKEWLHLFRDLVFQDINVIFNAWEFPFEMRNSSGVVETRTYPLIGKKIAPQACGIVDVVGQLECNEKTQNRRVLFGQNKQYITKCQFKGLDQAEPANLSDIIAKLRSYDYTKVEETQE